MKLFTNYLLQPMKNLPVNFLIALSTFGSFFFFWPAEVYFGNIFTFNYDFRDIIIFSLYKTFGHSLFLGFFISFITNKYDLQSRVQSLLVGFVVFVWIQSVFLNPSGVLLDGTFNDAFYLRDTVLSIITMSLLLYICVRYYKQIVNNFIFVIGIVLLAQSLSVCLSAYSAIQIKNSVSHNRYTANPYTVEFQDDMFEFSKNKNIVWIVLDSFSQDDLETIIDIEPEIAKSFKDFIYFNNYSGVFPYTDATGAVQLSGVKYDNSVPFKQFLKESFSSGKSIVERLNEANWSTRFYGMDLAYFLTPELYDNIIPVSGKYYYAKQFSILLNSSFIRGMPPTLRRKIVLEGINVTEILDNFLQRLLPVGKPDARLSGWDFWFLDKIMTKKFTNKSANPIFFFAHLQGPHDPFVVDENLSIIKTSDSKRQAKASLRLLEKMLAKMQDAGVYENSLIIITADHGRDNRYRNKPILLVKGINQYQNEINSLDTPFYQQSLSEEVEKLINGEYMTVKEFLPVTERKFYHYGGYWTNGYSPTLIEYIVPEFVKDYDNYTVTGRMFFPAVPFVEGIKSIEFPSDYEKYKNMFSDGWIKTKTGVVLTPNPHKVGRILMRGLNLSDSVTRVEFTYVKPTSADKSANNIEIACNEEKKILEISSADKTFSCDFFSSQLVTISVNGHLEIKTIKFSEHPFSEVFGLEYGKVNNLNELSQEIFVTGWNNKEESHIWSSNQESKLIIPFKSKPKADVVVNFDILAYIRNDSTPQSVTIKSGDTILVKDIFTKARGYMELTFILPRELIKNDIAEIVIESSYVSSPLENGESQDGRALGIALRSIKVDELFSFPLGEIVNLSSIPDYSLPNGWNEKEAAHVWSSSKDAELRLLLRELATEALSVTLDLGAYIKKDNEPKTVTVMSEGKELSKVTFTREESSKQVSFIVPKKLIKDNFIELDIHSSYVSSPLENGEAQDGRTLGIALRSVTISNILK